VGRCAVNRNITRRNAEVSITGAIVDEIARDITRDDAGDITWMTYSRPGAWDAGLYQTPRDPTRDANSQRQ